MTLASGLGMAYNAVMQQQDPDPEATAEPPLAVPNQKIIIVEDDPALADIYKTRLEMIGYTCFIGYNGITGLYFIQKEQPDLVLLDLMIPDLSGGEVLETMRRSDWGRYTKVLVISNLNEAEAPSNLRMLGIEDYIVKANMANDDIERFVNKILRPEMLRR
jgi:DNA-binding response OmpR family regulator